MKCFACRSLTAPLLVALALFLIAGIPGQAGDALQITPLLLAVKDAPVPFPGSDGRVHFVYELWLTNFSSGDATLEKVEVLGDGIVLARLDARAIAQRLQPAGLRESAGSIARSTQALLFMNVALAPGGKIPGKLSHRVTLRASAAPPGHQEITESGGNTAVNQQQVVRIGPPLHGSGYISADSCCDSTRHVRAALPVDGHVWLAQRFAVDWEQLNSAGRIYSGPREKLESYAIFGKPVLAVANAVVVATTNGFPEQTPGKYPSSISLDEADGNSIILDLGAHRYALYAHLQPGSLKVHRGDRVKLGQVIALVGDSGNSLAPHLHFQVMDRPSSLASNGLPYEIDSFKITGATPGTEAFDKAEADGTPLPVKPQTPARQARGALPLDQQIISF